MLVAANDLIAALLTTLPHRSREAWSRTTIEKTLWPPRAGTRRWREVFGKRLICVRYRYSSDGDYRYTTVELLVDHGRVSHKPSGRPGYTVRLREDERALALRLSEAGARWDAERGRWQVKAAVVRRLKLQGRAQRVKAE